MKASFSCVILLSLALTGVVRAAGPCPERDSAVDVLLRNPDDCATYYQCAHGEPVLLPCPRGLYWNDDTKLCDFPDQAGCHAPPPATRSRAGASDFVPQSVVERCRRSSTGTRLADPEDCAGFYMCVAKRPVGEMCPPGLLYNDGLQVCDWPENVDCCENGGETPEDPPEPNQTTGKPEAQPPTCEEGVEFIPNPEDCTSFYQCSHGIPKLHNCPDGLHWNQKLSMCDYAENTECR